MNIKEVQKDVIYTTIGDRLAIPKATFDWLIEQAGKAEKQHFEILALEANLKGNDKIIEEQQKEIEEWKEKEFRACSKHHEFIDEIERLEKESDQIILEKTDRINGLEEEIKLLKNALKRIDLRDEHLCFTSVHFDDGEAVHQLLFTDTVVVLNEEQMERLRG